MFDFDDREFSVRWDGFALSSFPGAGGGHFSLKSRIPLYSAEGSGDNITKRRCGI